MKRLLNLGLLIAFQFCYLEWPNHSMYVFEAEKEIFTKTENWISNFTHPIILIGLVTQIVLLLGAILPNINSKINTLSVLLLGVLVLLFAVVGVLSLNYKIIFSTLPFLIVTVIYFVKNSNKISIST